MRSLPLLLVFTAGCAELPVQSGEISLDFSVVSDLATARFEDEVTVDPADWPAVQTAVQHADTSGFNLQFLEYLLTDVGPSTEARYTAAEIYVAADPGDYPATPQISMPEKLLENQLDVPQVVAGTTLLQDIQDIVIRDGSLQPFKVKVAIDTDGGVELEQTVTLGFEGRVDL
ncbi:MAG: hypothetical protein D6798_12150 [Deltaproteobacteria bacterium]|nr:MAG: hypothetical protein D6798_12150 [Deltaproteobacteria bacterium]